jgi:hypothetical protein
MEEINTLASRTPKAALRMLGLEGVTQTQTTSGSPAGTVNTTEFNPNTQSYIGRNARKLEVGATAQELNEEAAMARKMVQELEQRGMSIDDLTKPSNYFKLFK